MLESTFWASTFFKTGGGKRGCKKFNTFFEGFLKIKSKFAGFPKIEIKFAVKCILKLELIL